MKYTSIFIFLLLMVLFSTEKKTTTIVPPSIQKRIQRSTERKYYLFVIKKKFILYVIRTKDHHPLKSYPVAIGSKAGFEIKTHAGDHGTPEGYYYITDILGYHFPKKDRRYQGMRRMNRIYFSRKNGYHKWGHPDKDLGNKAYGPAFLRINYPNQSDERRYERLKKANLIPKKKGWFKPIGGGLGIHGTNDPKSIGHCATTGCIRMVNKDIQHMIQYIRLGTVVYIVKE